MSNEVKLYTHWTKVKAYAIYNQPTGLYFIWSYTDFDFAQAIAGRISPGNAQDRAANWRALIEQCCLSVRTGDAS
jgi:hypothetical protein